jgi:hypothetical protein
MAVEKEKKKHIKTRQWQTMEREREIPYSENTVVGFVFDRRWAVLRWVVGAPSSEIRGTVLVGGESFSCWVRVRERERASRGAAVGWSGAGGLVGGGGYG